MELELDRSSTHLVGCAVPVRDSLSGRIDASLARLANHRYPRGRPSPRGPSRGHGVPADCRGSYSGLGHDQRPRRVRLGRRHLHLGTGWDRRRPRHQRDGDRLRPGDLARWLEGVVRQRPGPLLRRDLRHQRHRGRGRRHPAHQRHQFRLAAGVVTRRNGHRMGARRTNSKPPPQLRDLRDESGRLREDEPDEVHRGRLRHRADMVLGRQADRLLERPRWVRMHHRRPVVLHRGRPDLCHERRWEQPAPSVVRQRRLVLGVRLPGGTARRSRSREPPTTRHRTALATTARSATSTRERPLEAA